MTKNWKESVFRKKWFAIVFLVLILGWILAPCGCRSYRVRIYDSEEKETTVPVMVYGATPWYYHFSLWKMLNASHPLIFEGAIPLGGRKVPADFASLHFEINKADLPMRLTFGRGKEEHVFKIEPFDKENYYARKGAPEKINLQIFKSDDDDVWNASFHEDYPKKFTSDIVIPEEIEREHEP